MDNTPKAVPPLKAQEDRTEKEDSEAIKSVRNAFCFQCLRLTQSDSEKEKDLTITKLETSPL